MEIEDERTELHGATPDSKHDKDPHFRGGRQLPDLEHVGTGYLRIASWHNIKKEPATTLFHHTLAAIVLLALFTRILFEGLSCE